MRPVTVRPVEKRPVGKGSGVLGTKLARRVGIDLRRDALYWAEAGGLGAKRRLRRSGRIMLEDETGLADAVRALRREVGARASFCIVLQHGDLRHERLELPAMPKRDLRRIGQRRSVEFARDFGHDSVTATLLPRAQGGPLWLALAPAQASRAAFESWREHGVTARAAHSHHLALAELGRFVRDRDPEHLIAVLDVSEHAATCVIVDIQGWVFSREIPLKFAGERTLREESPEDFELDPLEDGVNHAERLHTELVRTFHYVQSQLMLGQVGRVVLCGDHPDLYALSAVLATNLELPVEVMGQACELGLSTDPLAEAAAAIGAALAPTQGNLLPPDLKALTHAARVRRHLSAGLLGSILITGGLGVFVFTHSSQLQRELASLRAQWETQRDRREQLLTAKQMREDAAALEAFWAELAPQQPRTSASLRTLGAALPPALHVEHLRIEKRDDRWRAAIVVAAEGGGTESADAVSRWSQRLSASPLFAVHELTRAASAARDAGESLRFQVNAELAPIQARANTPRGEGRE